MATGLGELAETGTLSHRTAQCLHASTPASAEHRMLQLADQLHGRRILFDQLAWRARELTGLRDIHDLTERSDLGQDELLARVAERLTRAMRWPDHAHVWIRGAGLAVGQPRPGPCLSATFLDQHGQEGEICVTYDPAGLGDAAQPVVWEERMLVQATAHRLGAMMQHRRVRQDEWQLQTQLRAVFEQAPFAIYVVDPESLAFELVNPAACQSLGYTREQLLGMHLQDIQASLNLNELHADVRISLAGTREIENRYRRRDGATFRAGVRVGPLRLDGRDLLLVMWNEWPDGRSPVLPTASVQPGWTVLDAVSQGVVVVSISGLVIAANAMALRLLRCSSRAALIGQPVSALFAPGLGEAGGSSWPDPVQQVLSAGAESSGWVTLLRRSDGSHLAADLALAPWVLPDGMAARVITFSPVRDPARRGPPDPSVYQVLGLLLAAGDRTARDLWNREREPLRAELGLEADAVERALAGDDDAAALRVLEQVTGLRLSPDLMASMPGALR